MGGIDPVSTDLQNAVQIAMLKKAMVMEAQPLQLLAGLQQAVPAAQSPQVQPVDQKFMGLGTQIDVYG